MGIIIAKFRKKTTNVQLLEKLDKQIKEIEDYGRNTEQRHRTIAGRFLILSIGIYVVLALFFYFGFHPTTLKQRLCYLIPLLLAPITIYSLKKLLTWYYNRKISKNQSKIGVLREDKRKLIDSIMETETYKVAKTLLEKYAPEHVRKGPLIGSSELTPVKALNVSAGPSVLRNRFPATKAPIDAFKTPSRAALDQPDNKLVPAVAGSALVPRTPLPRAILPRDRSILDKMVEYLVGDGPANRFALICKQCASHNGMALREEFEYISFRCCYCYTYNAARKKRLLAPKLELEASPPRRNTSDTSESEKNSGSDSDETAAPTKPVKIETLFAKERRRTSDGEHVSDFDKLSDIETKTSDNDDPKRIKGDGATH